MIHLNQLLISILKNQKGFVLVTSYVMLSASLAMSLATFARNGAFQQAIERNMNKTIAFNMAESAMDLAITQLAADGTYTGTNGFTSLSSNHSSGGYSVTVTTPVDNPNVRIISASGSAPGSTSSARAYESRSTTSYVQLSEENLFAFSIFSDNDVSLNGNAVVDSYNSTVGAYDSSSAGSNGDVGTNGTGTADVSVVGNAAIKGDVVVGPSGDPNDVVSVGGNGYITGTQTAATTAKVYDPITTSSSSLGSLSVKGNSTVTLAAGTYHYDSISVSGNGSIATLGAVTIYVDGDVSIAGNGVSTASNSPPNFLLYSAGDDVSISGNGNFFGGIYAPNAAVDISGNGDVYGAVVAETYDQNGNGSFHYDEALQDVGSSGNYNISLLAWQESNTSAWGTGSNSGAYSN